MEVTTKKTSEEVVEALEAVFRSLSVDETLGQYWRDRNKYDGCFQRMEPPAGVIPAIQVEDPNGLLKKD